MRLALFQKDVQVLPGVITERGLKPKIPSKR